MKRLAVFATGIGLMMLAACGTGPGVAPEPSSSPQHYDGDLPSGTSNDVFHGR